MRMAYSFYIHTQISNDHEPDRYSNIASDMELSSVIFFVADYLMYGCQELRSSL